MSENQELRQNWRRNWLCSIQEFSDLKTQRRLWLDPNASNPHYTFVEYMCCYFDGLAVFDDPSALGEHYTVAREQGLVNADEAAAIEPFHAILAAYDAPGKDDYDHQAILADPKWMEVVAAAKSAQAALLPLICDAEERRELMEKSIYAVEAGAKD
ncbi:hypothetical protein [Blastomonas fulva]|jgi:hypothetical protein|uniref:Uncharacterized protein n=1 Tax=Blastomonas fulva TaxID=1550728 RepID=A0ABM6M5V0_9SPHN|nr:hypothetical protein [Blastomonas fulva]ASR51299.1 hypothetical protein B5J99_07280 [Blastomonas fulva]